MSLSPSSSPSSSSAAATIATAIPLSTALATIASPSPITALPAPNHNPSSVSRRGLPPPCWTNEETLALIDSYKEKWYSLNRSNLRAAHWDEVAAAVAARSRQIPAATPKTSVQCRHKIEKLRKRYRSERQRSLAHNPHAPPSSPWIFFSKMDQMENPNSNSSPNWYQNVPNGSGGGGMKFKIPKAVRTSVGNPNPNWYEGCEDDDEIEYRRSGGNGGGLKFKIPRAVRSSVGNPNFNSSYSVKPELEEMRRRLEAKRRREEVEEEEEEEDDDDEDSSLMGEMARVLRMFGDGYMRMEQMKMEMAREMERARMEMELKRTEMILDTQKKIVDAFVKGVMGDKKVKRSPNC